QKEERAPYAPELLMGAQVCNRARELGMITRPLGDLVVFMPPLSSTAGDLDAMLDILFQSIREVTKET
ncbi:MAG: adenosylmethionine--8-amino-7-oxononanoate transaminase, partial [Armatimonadota bacterium]|nr:adenosylmethionine--8-amino-7-oxononanoate transaminase [Armatimonadota bacterium]